MALPDHHRLQEINQIAEALSSCECRTLSYLCGSLELDSSVLRVKDMLKSKVLCHENSQLFLEELVLQLGRFDILRRVYNVSRGDIERTLKYRQVLPRFRVLMATISQDLVIEDVDRIKFLLSRTLSREKMENAKNFLDVITELEKLDSVSPERVDMVEECLVNIGRVDLAKKVKIYKMSVETPERHSSQQQSCRASFAPQQIRSAQSLHIATVKMPLAACRDQSFERPQDSYKFNTNPRGVCVIIDCVGNDGDMLEQTFKALHFNVTLCKWLSAHDIFSTLKKISIQREKHKGDGFVCCIISRGTANNLQGIDLYDTGLSLDSIRQLFTADACPTLAGKPKLFFIQRYSVLEVLPSARMNHRDEDLETDGGLSRCEYIPTDADVFWSHCWTNEHELEQEQHRSMYLKALTDGLHKDQRRRTHLVDIHTEVNGAIFEHNKKNPRASYHFDVKHTLRKDLYLK
ncbi:CASP8 and FADD-like apoptosis regulator [Brachyistius frenatus]|uniref:CASP8 and FADD-like apoptosis regulator n=1 Tax=Brachyistius frenatus TaxID=100188 RepID=UPI0037E72AB2